MTIERIEKYENILNDVLDNINNLQTELIRFKKNKKNINLLNKYYGSKNWFKDKEAYENNKIPRIKAGVLSEDTVWNMQEEINDIIKEIQTIININNR